jgi:hypothetical protein
VGVHSLPQTVFSSLKQGDFKIILGLKYKVGVQVFGKQ